MRLRMRLLNFPSSAVSNIGNAALRGKWLKQKAWGTVDYVFTHSPYVSCLSSFDHGGDG